MKNIAYGLVLLVLFFGVGFYIGHGSGESQASANYESTIDTIQKVLKLPPDTIHTRDTLYIYSERVDTVYTPIITAVNEDTSFYSDTIRNSDLEFIINDKVKGVILSRQTGYTIRTPLIIDTIRVFKNIPQLIEIEKPVNYTSYIRTDFGFNYYSVGYGRILNGQHQTGFNLGLFHSKPFVSISYTYLMKNK